MLKSLLGPRLVVAALFFLACPAAAPCEGPSGYRLLAVGVNQYAHKDVNDLPGCDVDTHALADLLAKWDPAVERQPPLLNEKATRRRILEELKALAKSAPPECLAVVLLSGHGGRSRGDWYFAPHDYDPRRPEETGVRDGEILDELAPLIRRGGHVVLVLDSCHSGQVRHCAERKGLLAPAKKGGPDRGGLVLLAAAIPEQTCLGGQSGGYLTRALIEALRGAADQDEDGLVTFREVRRYLNYRVKQIATEHYKIPGLTWPEQDSDCDVSPALGESFPLARVPKKSRPAPDYGFETSVLPPPPDLAPFYAVGVVKKGAAGRAPGLWYWERVAAKRDGTRLKQAYVLALSPDGFYEARLYSVIGAKVSMTNWAGRYVCEEGKPFELDFGNGYDILNNPVIEENVLTFSHVLTYGGQKQDEPNPKRYSLRRVKDLDAVMELIKAR